ncbi:hypothetical protein ACJVDH_20780 [Pedobacter sp. AW1-32]|uniref:hypothetical protein n=1 Tax=Pedobacter sp. AW1-32 TaxID=3383026 RepID=UPI003FF0E2A4
MRPFRFLLAFAAAVGTFYSLNALAVQKGYPNRLDFSNRHYQHRDCGVKPHQNYRHHNDTAVAPVSIDTTFNNK